MNPDDDDLPRHIVKSLPRPVYADAKPPVLVRLAAMAAAVCPRPARTCRACGAPLDRTEAFCSLPCFRAGPRDE